MNITIYGGGNIGTQFAVHCASKGHRVIVYSKMPEKFSNKLNIVNKAGEELLSAQIDKATSDKKEAFSDADLIFVIVPAFCMKDAAQNVIPFIKSGASVCIVPGTGGGECAFKPILEKNCTIMGLQRVPSVARLVEYGKTVCATGYRDELFLSAIPNVKTNEGCKIISSIFDMKCSALPNYLNLTLTPSNPILHTTRLRTIFKDYKKGKTYNTLPLFYENWDNESSELLFKCDDEVQAICGAIKDFDLSLVKSLKVHYESDTIQKMTDKISSIEGFKGLTTPSVKNEDDTLSPDFNSRYFTADFSYGLTIIKQISDFVGVDTPNIDEVINWYYSLGHDNKSYDFEEYGIKTYDDFVSFYSM